VSSCEVKLRIVIDAEDIVSRLAINQVGLARRRHAGVSILQGLILVGILGCEERLVSWRSKSRRSSSRLLVATADQVLVRDAYVSIAHQVFDFFGGKVILVERALLFLQFLLDN
jgi:hypothetical protein